MFAIGTDVNAAPVLGEECPEPWREVVLYRAPHQRPPFV